MDDNSFFSEANLNALEAELTWCIGIGHDDFLWRIELARGCLDSLLDLADKVLEMH